MKYLCRKGHSLYNTRDRIFLYVSYNMKNSKGSCVRYFWYFFVRDLFASLSESRAQAIYVVTVARCDLNYSSEPTRLPPFHGDPFFRFVPNDRCNWPIRASLLFPGRVYELNRVAECNSARRSHRFAPAPPENCARHGTAFTCLFRALRRAAASIRESDRTTQPVRSSTTTMYSPQSRKKLWHTSRRKTKRNTHCSFYAYRQSYDETGKFTCE